MQEYFDYNLLHHNTFGISETCHRFVEYASIAELRHIIETLTPADRPLLHIGGGSNLLLTGHYPGTIIHSAIRGITVTDQGDSWLMCCGSGEVWDDVVAYAVSHGMYGMENLSLIPGEVGASAVQNIGAYGREACDVIDSVHVVSLANGQESDIPCADCGYAYRQSNFKSLWQGRYAITHVTYRLSKTFTPHLDYGNIRSSLQEKGITTPTAQDVRQTVIGIRQSKLPDPAVEGNAGSFFMNPVVSRAQYERIAEQYPDMPHYPVDDSHVKLPAGWLIDQCGWRGRSLSRAGVHSSQALVLVNRGDATGKDVIDLANAIRHDVKAKFDIYLHPEVIYV